jgi:catechol 2,3-dioxygenase-like lactoylglutathione lyase family enzyme
VSAATSGLHHVGVPVSNMDRSLAFYKDVLGFTEVGIVVEAAGEALEGPLQVENPSLKAVFLQSGDLTLELIEYYSPEMAPYTTRNCDVGAVHVCLLVEDIQAVHQTLLDAGVSVNAPPLKLEEGDLAGHSFCYFRDPDGIQLELFQRP